MSDLFNLEDELEDAVFQPEAFVRDLCKDKITFGYGTEIRFPSGWKTIVQDFIDSTHSHSIGLVQITDRYQQLDIRFEPLKKTKELAVWRAVEEARLKSRSICACCGQEKHTRWGKRSLNVLCETCIKDAGRLGKTGTWLDKY